MLLTGLVSVTFRKLSPAEIVALVKKAGLVGIEWGGDVHVPPGDLVRAREVRDLTEQSGLKVAAYGSYYRAGQSDGIPFETILKTALELGAPTIRVWAGTAGSDATDEATRWRVIADLRRIADLAAKAMITISLEFHGGTLTDTNESAAQLLVEVGRENVLTYWQPHNGEETGECVRGLRDVLPKVSNVHVFHWWPTAAERLPLADGAGRWAKFLELIRDVPGERYAMLEFVPGDAVDAFLRDAEVLKCWVG